MAINILMVSSLAPSSVIKQIVAWAIGIGLFFIGSQINPEQIKSSKTVLFILSCLMLLTPILLNNITRGSRRWIDVGPLSFQPSEIVKPLLLLYIIHSNVPYLIAIPVAIIMMQPDLGSAISVMFLLAPVVLYNQKLFKIGLIVLAIGTALSPVIWNKVLHDYQKHRILNFIAPQSDPLGKGYNVLQAKIAIGSGGFFGKGYRQGTQSQLLFLPEKHTDFMFSAIGEELGLIGICTIIFCYFLLIKTLITKAYTTTSNRALFLFTLGIALQIWLQSFVNIGMNVGLLPVTGIPLPFLSVGGSSIMTLLFSLGIIFSS
ncbi:rod shape-determining protein RodA [Candidatus Shapirobacteria bacterium]|nr:rod shape-determining protein RodA [Candidatus Shapirobacteria bacterium]